ncbi:hypothetical protein BBJ28_00005169 [Nothophytophthora sp. Chile5]|nr:hypothetical protein BBJ28_00005169 [Nothophytophthora sp. Chile5]
MKQKTPLAVPFRRPKAGQGAASSKTKLQKRKARRSAVVVRPWTSPQFEELSKEERDIVLDRLQKEVVDVGATRAHVAHGVNHVARCVARGELRVVVFANNPESLAFGHLPLLCRLHQVPICVLHLSSKTFGRLFQLKSLVAMGLKAPAPRDASTNASQNDNSAETGEEEKAGEIAPTASAIAATATTSAPLSDAERAKLASITGFLIAKASKKTRS